LSDTEEDYAMMMEENNLDVDEEEVEGKREAIKEEGAAEVADAKERDVQELGDSLRASLEPRIGSAARCCISFGCPSNSCCNGTDNTHPYPRAGDGRRGRY
jgi:hypothetical protein